MSFVTRVHPTSNGAWDILGYLRRRESHFERSNKHRRQGYASVKECIKRITLRASNITHNPTLNGLLSFSCRFVPGSRLQESSFCHIRILRHGAV